MRKEIAEVKLSIQVHSYSVTKPLIINNNQISGKDYTIQLFIIKPIHVSLLGTDLTIRGL